MEFIAMFFSFAAVIHSFSFNVEKCYGFHTSEALMLKRHCFIV